MRVNVPRLIFTIFTIGHPSEHRKETFIIVKGAKTPGSFKRFQSGQLDCQWKDSRADKTTGMSNDQLSSRLTGVIQRANGHIDVRD